MVLFVVLSLVFLPILESALTSRPIPIDVRYTYTSIFVVMLLVLMVVVNWEKLFKHHFKQSIWQTVLFCGVHTSLLVRKLS